MEKELGLGQQFAVALGAGGAINNAATATARVGVVKRAPGVPQRKISERRLRLQAVECAVEARERLVQTCGVPRPSASDQHLLSKRHVAIQSSLADVTECSGVRWESVWVAL